MSEALTAPRRRVDAVRHSVGLVASLVLLAGLFWSSLASAAPSTYPGCATRNVSVAWGGSVYVDLSTCHDFGLGVVSVAPAHGSTSEVGAPVNGYTYAHNGATPVGGGSDTFVVLDDFSDEITVNVTIDPPTSAIVVNPASLPALTAGTPFSQTLTSSGGTAPYTYTLQSGTLPVGLSLSSSGLLSGTPTQRGGYTFTVRSTDSTSPTAEFADKAYNGNVDAPTLVLSPGSATAIQNIAFSQQLATAGGVAPHTYQLESGSFPAGINISTSGLVSGTTAAAPGNYPVLLRVTDASTGPGAYFELENFTLSVSPPPSVSIAVSPASVSEDGATNLVYTVTRNLNLASATVVNITTSGTATSGIDYTGAAATATIPGGATTATVVIDPTADGSVEPDETVTLTVAAGTGYSVGAPANATGTILNDDVPSATIAVSPSAVAEDGATNLVYTVTLDQPASSPVSVSYTIGGTAGNGSDYAAITSPLVIPAGNTTGTITVNPTADATIEADETVSLTLAAGAGYTVGAPNGATGTILNDDLPSLTINNVTASEGNAGTTSFTFTVSLSAPAGPGGVSFDIATANGTANDGVDYVARNLLAETIPAGNSTYTFTVQVNGDVLNEPSETFFVNLTSVVGAVVVDGQGLGTIVNDDPLPALSIGDVSVVEGNAGTSNAVFTVSLSAASGQTVTVNYATADGTAVQPADYTSTSGTLTFTPGQTSQTISVPVIGETLPEANETFFVNLSGATNATISDNQGVGTITNDDAIVDAVNDSGSVANGASGGTAVPSLLANDTLGAAPATLANVALTQVSTTSPNVTVNTGTGEAVVAPGTPAGTYTLTYQICDLANPTNCDQAFATITVGAAVIDAVNDSGSVASGAAGGTAVPNVLVNDTLGGNPASTANVSLSFLSSSSPNLTLDATSGAVDVAPGTAPGNETLDYFICELLNPTNCDIAQVSVTINEQPPVANNVSSTVAYGSGANPVVLNITGGTATSVAIATPPSNGTAIATGTSITYQPNAGYAGPDSFTYTATNADGTSAPGTVSVTVNDPVVTITASGGFAATVAAPYTQTFTFNGGAQPWSGYQVTNLPAGLSITGTTANTVTVSGTPTEVGSFNLNVSATDSSTGNGPYTVGQAYALTVGGPTLFLTPAPGTLNAPYGSAFSQSFAAGGGTGPYTYAVTGALPAGLSLSGDTISGTPTVPGSYPVTVTATDTGSTGVGAPFTVANSYTIDVLAPTIVVDPATLPDPVIGAAYAQAVIASGGVGPYGYAVTGGALPTGLSLSAGGALSGTATEVGSFNFTVTATDANGQTGSRAYTFAVAAPVLAMTPAPGTLNAPYGAAFSQSFAAGGGTGPYTYAVTGALPAGLSLSGDTISGTPTVPGSYAITVTATDTGSTGVGAPFTVANSYTIDVLAPTIVVDPATLPDPVAGAAYTQSVTASGGVGPHGFAVTAGTLPTGLSLSAGGALSGTTNEVGSFNFTVTATDANGQTGSRAYTLVVAAPVLTMTPAAGTLNAPYATGFSQAFTASGGSGSFSYALTGTLPAGMAFSGDTLSGTPTEPGSYAITVTATDTVLTGTGAPFSIAQAYTLEVPAPTIVVDPATLADGTAGTPYAATLSATGGVGPHGFAVTTGTLPAGLALDASGALSGTPTASGTFNITVTATDANGQTGSRAYALVIASPVLSITPATLPSGIVGVAYSQSLSASGGNAPYSFAVAAGTLPDGLALSAGGALTGTPTAQGTFAFTVTATDSTTGTAGSASLAYSVEIVFAPPVAVDDTAVVLAGESVTIAVTANDTSAAPIDSIAIATPPSEGTAVVSGLEIIYTAPTLAPPTVQFTYTSSGSGGSSNPATVTLTVNPLPIPVVQAVSTLPATPVTVDITAGATGGPFTAADIVAVTPAGSGTATVAPGGSGYLLTFTPDAAFTGLATVEFTISNAFATSAVTTLEVTVEARPDPSQDPEVTGLIDGQAESTRRFATAQIGNFQQRLEHLHRGGGGSSNNLGFGVDPRCDEPLVGQTLDGCAETDLATGARGRSAGASGRGDGQASPWGVWVGGMIRSGSLDGRAGRPDLDFETDGVSAGVDYRVNDGFAFGAGFGWGQDEVQVGRNGSRIQGDARTLALYGSWHAGQRMFVDGVVGVQDLRFDLRRYLTGTGGFVGGRRDGDQWFASVTAGSEIDRGGMRLAPYLRYDVARAELDAYVESGHPILALAYAPMDVDTSIGTLGLRLEWRRDVTWGSFTPQVRLEYQQDFSGRTSAEVGYADLPGGPTYGIAASRFDRNRFVAGLGALFDTDLGWNWRVEYRGQVGGDGEDHGIQVNVQKQF